MEVEVANSDVSNPPCAEVPAKGFSIIALRAGDGRYLGTRSVSDLTLVASRELTDAFERVDLKSGKVALRSLRSGRYVSSAGPSEFAATGEKIGPAEIFTELRSEGGKVALQLSDGARYVSAPKGDDAVASTAESVNAGELFEIQPVAAGDSGDSASHSHGCCGPERGNTLAASGEVGPLWNERTHSEVVENGVHLLRAAQEAEAREFIRLWDAGPGFAHATKKGLEDADKIPPYNGVYCSVHPMYNNHFYVPSTGMSYNGQPHSALTDGRRYFNLAVHTGRRIHKLGSAAPAELYRRAGYYLGLSLHFLTDLTQPMHAAGFTNVYGEGYPGDCAFGHTTDRRHSGYEEYADERVKDGYFKNYPPLRPGDLDITGIESPDALLHNTASASKHVFDELLLQTVRKKVELRGENGIFYYYFERKWTAADRNANASMDVTLWIAPRDVAKYVFYWTRCMMNQPLQIDQRRWYRIIEPLEGQPLKLTERRVYRANRNAGDDSWFYFLFNPDGTVSIGCKAWKPNLWYLYNMGGDAWSVGEDNNARGTPKKESRFRLVAAPNNKVRIFEPTKDEVISSLRSEAFLRRWNPDDDGSQLFTLEPGDLINSSDYGEIKKLFPDFGEYDWWGNATV